MTVVSWSHNRYPTMLAAIQDPSPVLWIRGRVEALHAPAVAIVWALAPDPPMPARWDESWDPHWRLAASQW